MIQFLNKKMRNRKGFTLIELIVVIAILGILAAIAVPRFTGFTDKANIQTMKANEKLVNNLLAVYKAENSKYPDITAAGDKTGFENLLDALQTAKLLDANTVTELKKTSSWNGKQPTYTKDAETITIP